MDKLKVNDNALTLKQRNTLFFLVEVLFIIALAQPVLKNGKVKVHSTSADILIAIDISDSMLAEDVYPNRLELAKIKALKLIQKATNDRIGVVAFAENSYLVSPISFDAKTVAFLVSKLDTQSITQKGTDILTMLETIAKANTNTKKKYVLLLSDGGDASDFSAEIAFAKEKGIVVFVLGMGTEDGMALKNQNGSFIKDGDIIVVSKLNDAVSELAIQTGGVYIQNTTSSRDIEAMLKKIIENSEHKELKSQEVERYVALFYYPIILAMLILLIAFSSIVKRVKTNTSASMFVLCALVLSSSPSFADFFDFKNLHDAQKSYNAKDYNSSSEVYIRYAKKTDNGSAYYNAGNAYYKEKRYLKALSAYSFARVKSKDLRASKLANMGNTLTRLATKNTLEKAVKHYEASLKIKEDKFIRENLEAVKKALESVKKKKSQEEKQQKQEDKNKKYSEQKTDAKGDMDEASKTNNPRKHKNRDSKNQNAGKNKKSDKDANSKKNKSDDASKEKDNNDANEDGSGDSNNAGDTNGQAKDIKNKNKNEVKNQENEMKSGSKPQKMSNLEKAKWFKKLSVNQSTYLYRLNEEKTKREKKNAKPW